MIQVKDNQSIMDVVLNELGSMESGISFCLANNRPISDIPLPGTELKSITSDVADTDAVKYLRKAEIVIGTANLTECAIITTINADTIGPTEASFSIGAGEDSVGIEWVALPDDGTEPTEGTLTTDGTVTATGLTPSTNYKLWARSKCLGNFSAWQGQRFTTEDPPPLSWRTVLRPVMRVQPDMSVGNPNTADLYKFEVLDAPEFVNIHALAASYGGDNMVFYITEERLISGIPQQEVPTTSLPATDKRLPYELTYTTGIGYMFVWSSLVSSYRTVTFTDVEGNSAYYAPVWVFDNNTQEMLVRLLANLTIELVSANTTEVVLRLTRSHGSILPAAGFTWSMAWLEAALGGTADPDDPLNTNKKILTLTPGIYKVGVRTNYTNSHPSSAFTMVLEVYNP